MLQNPKLSSAVFSRLRLIDLVPSLSSVFSFFLSLLSPDIRRETMSPQLSLSVSKYFHQGDHRWTPWRMQIYIYIYFFYPSYSYVHTYKVRNTVSITFIRENCARSLIPFVTACIKEKQVHPHAELPSISEEMHARLSRNRREKNHAIEGIQEVMPERSIPIHFEQSDCYETTWYRECTISFSARIRTFHYSTITRGCCGIWKRSSRADIYLDSSIKLSNC